MSNQDMLESGDIVMNSDVDMANRVNNYDHVESTVVKKD